jgi:DNA-binding NtrC family response regulator
VERAEAQIIARSLRLHDWNQTRSAEALGVSRRALVQKIAKYGLRRQSQPRNV